MLTDTQCRTAKAKEKLYRLKKCVELKQVCLQYLT